MNAQIESSFPANSLMAHLESLSDPRVLPAPCGVTGALKTRCIGFWTSTSAKTKAAQNLALLRQPALNLLQQEQSVIKLRTRRKRKVAAWDNDSLPRLLQFQDAFALERNRSLFPKRLLTPERRNWLYNRLGA